MKKFLLFTLLFLGALGAHAAEMSASYMYSSDYHQYRLGALADIGQTFLFGLEGKAVDDRIKPQNGGRKNPVWSVAIPLQLDLDLLKFNISPFYYLPNRDRDPQKQDAYAFGVAGQIVMNLRTDEIEELYTQAYLGASFARQKAELTRNDTTGQEMYSELAYTLGLRQNFFGFFTFHVSGTGYHYPNGVKNVQAINGIFDQNDLAFTQSYDVNRQLGKYVISARVTRIWLEERSTAYVGYHFQNFYTADNQHSFIIGNSFYVAPNTSADLAYNHLQTIHGNNKRDIFYVRLVSTF